MQIIRPNGSIYRPRKVRAELLGDEDEITGVLVFGTHDWRFAYPIAVSALEAIRGEFYASDYRLVITGAPRLVWKRKDLWGWREDSPWYGFTTDENKGYAAVQFDVDEEVA